MKKMLILRGLPGSGKSSFARGYLSPLDQVTTCVILSTDDYWRMHKMDFGPQYLPDAHKWNLHRSIDAMKRGVHLVIIDNTNIKKWHYSSYIESAAEFGYEVEEMIIGKFDADSQLEYFHRCIHNCPYHTIQKMAEDFEK